MGKQPRMSVLMSVYNGERHLKEAVEGILWQTFVDFEFIVIDDGSTDNTSGILDSYTDPRIIRIKNECKEGLSKSLNHGLEIASGRYIARQDADDVSLPQRLEKQVEYLDRHKEVGVLGTACWIVDESGVEHGVSYPPLSDLDIRWTCLLGNPFWHPTIMLRHDVLFRYNLTYDESLQTAQDYELWTRVLKHTRGANLPTPLIRYRMGGGITSGRRSEQLATHDKIALRTIREQLPQIPIDMSIVTGMRVLFVGWNGVAQEVEAQRVFLAGKYYELLLTFLETYRGVPGLKKLARTAARRILSVVVRSPLQPGWRELLGKVIQLDPGSIPYLIFILIKRGFARMWGNSTPR